MPFFISLDIFYSLAKFTKAFKQLTGKPFLFSINRARLAAHAQSIYSDIYDGIKSHKSNKQNFVTSLINNSL